MEAGPDNSVEVPGVRCEWSVYRLSRIISGFALTQIISGTVANVDETIDANVAAAGFRFDTTAPQWIFNLRTSSESAGYTYVYAIYLNDGTRITFQYGLR